MPARVPPPLVCIDLDDTVWENARHFEHVVRAFGRLVASFGVDPARGRVELERSEDRNIPRTGYGTDPFLGSVRETLDVLLPQPTADQSAARETFLADARSRLRDHAIEFLPGVAEGLDMLAGSVLPVALTKGQPDEQEAKLARSGLAPRFRRLDVVPEKDDALYRRLQDAAGVPAGSCWMVGNSPRSDINPARRAGWRTVLVAHAAPWHRELEAPERRGPPTYVAQDFLDAARHVITGLARR